MDYKVVVGLPAYNEEAVLPQVLDALQQLRDTYGESLQIVVINDGSTDNTEDILHTYCEKNACISYITHQQNKGLGGAMKTLLYNAVSICNPDDVLITLDADNTHSPNIIPAMIDKLKKERLDVVIASRFISGGKEIGLSLNRKICSRGATYLLKTFFPIPNVHDYSCGYRAYQLGYLKKALSLYNGELITTDGFECMAEILAKFSRIGVTAGEYPLVLQYHLKNGKSKMRLVRTIMGYFRLLRNVKPPVYH